jgi:LPXTG-motif cell wall-anchored protein
LRHQFGIDVRKTLGFAALATATLSVAVVPAAGAQEASPGGAPAYEATSSGQALELSLFGQGLIVGEGSSRVAPGESAADGFALATPVFDGGVSSAVVQGTGSDGSSEPVCVQGFDQIPGLSLAFACSSSQVDVSETEASATSASTAGRIVLNPVAPLLETPLSMVVEPLQGGLQTLVGALEPVLGPIRDASGLDLQDTVGDLLDALLDGGDLVAIALGDSTTTSSLEGSMLSTTCAAEGTRIDVLDLPAVGGEDPPPVISVVLGDVSTRVDVDTTTGTGTPVANPSGVTIVVPSLGLDQPLALGQTIDIPLPEPLGTSTISVTDGVRGTDEQGRSFATADSVRLDLLNGEALMGGIELNVAQCSSLAGAVAQPAPEQPAPEAPAAPTLPVTGGEDDRSLALAATLALAGAGLALVRRRTSG